MKFFWCQGIFYMIFDFKNGFKNEFKDNDEKSCSWSRNRVSRKIDFKVQWLRNSHIDSVGVKVLSAEKETLTVWVRRVFDGSVKRESEIRKTTFEDVSYKRTVIWPVVWFTEDFASKISLAQQ